MKKGDPLSGGAISFHRLMFVSVKGFEWHHDR